MALVFDLLAKDGASGPFRNVGNAAERAGQQTSKFGTAMSGAMKLAGGALLGAGLVEGFKALYNAADESRKITALTAQVIKSTGGAANVSAKQVGDLAAQIAKKTGVDDEAIQSGQNLLLTFTNVRNEVGKGNDIFNQATSTITDMSVALGQDTSSSAIQLGKALNDPIKGVTALQRVGVSFTASQREQIKVLVESGDVLGAQKIILSELGKEFGGAAEAAATPLGKLQQRLGDLAEEVGGKLIPIVDQAATFFMDKLLPAFEDIGSLVAGVAIPAFKAIAAVVGAVADAFNALPGPVQTGVVALGAFALLRGPVTGAMETIGLKALYMKDAIVGAGTGIGGFKGAASGLLGFLGGPWGIAIAGATVGLGFLVNWLGKSDEQTQAVTQATQDYAGALRAANGVINESVRAAAAKAAQDAGLLDIAEKVGIALPDVTTAITQQGGALTSTRAQLEEFISSHTRLVTVQTGKGGAPQTTEALDEEGKAAQAALEALNSLAGQTTTTQGAQEQLTEATQSGTTSAQNFTAQTQASRDALDEAKQAIDDYKLSLDILTGNSVSMIQVESQLNDAIAAGTTAMTELGGEVLKSAGTLNLQSENGRKAADVLLDVRNSGNDLIATMIQQGATAQDVQKADADLRASFINTANQMGITGVDAEILADKILGIPSSRNTTITADTTQASGAVANLQKQIDGLHGRTVAILARGSLADVPGVQRFGLASGGPVPGWSPHSKADNIPLMGTAGEFMQPVSAVQNYGKGFMESVRTGRFPKALARGYANGGLIEVIADVTEFAANLKGALTPTGGTAGGGALGGGWQSIFNAVKAVIPQTRVNSSYRPGDPGYHGRGKAVDFGFGSGPGGNGSAGLALINRFLHDRYGRNLAELIYDGVGDDRPDLKNGKPLTYNAATRAQHHNHVHAAVYDGGGLLPPGLTLAYNGTGQNETIRTAGQEAALLDGVRVVGALEIRGDGLAYLVDARIQAREDRRNIDGRSWK